MPINNFVDALIDLSCLLNIQFIDTYFIVLICTLKLLAVRISSVRCSLTENYVDALIDLSCLLLVHSIDTYFIG